MFEDSTFESTGRIRTRSRAWMMAALALNSSILLALILVPLIYPEALPRQAIAFLMAVPTPPPSIPPAATHPVARTWSVSSTAIEDPFTAPPRIPTSIAMIRDAGPEPSSPIGNMDNGSGIPGGVGNTFGRESAPRVVHAAPAGPVHVASELASGLLINKVIPHYPQLGITMYAEGTVVLTATIAKDGTIANLRVLSGPPILQRAALDAVSQWRYRPYLLNGQPVDVETTVKVIFTLSR